MPYGPGKEFTCLECKCEFSHGKKFSTHLKNTHSLSAREYIIKHHYAGFVPTCEAPDCNAETRFSSFEFKRFCQEHAKLAAQIGGAQGGKAPAWNRGLSKETDRRLALQSERMSGAGNPFFGKKHTPETIESIRSNKRLTLNEVTRRISTREDKWSRTSSLDNYTSRQHDCIDFMCNVCGSVKSMTLQAFERGSLCLTCHKEATSVAQVAIAEHVRSRGFNDMQQSIRTVISPLELDVWVPSTSVAVEHHGLWFHSDHNGYDRKRHALKQKMCVAQDIRLLQFFSDEWRDKRSVCESIIDHALGKSRSIGARECSIVTMTSNEAQRFFDENHLAGHAQRSEAIGLEHEGRVIAAVSFRQPFHKKLSSSGTLELARAATSTGISCPGWLARLMSEAKNGLAKGSSSIMSYVDLRIGTGRSLEKIGFKMTSQYTENWWWTDGRQRYNRFKFKATNEKPEREVAVEAGVARIYGAGNATFVLTL